MRFMWMWILLFPMIAGWFSAMKWDRSITANRLGKQLAYILPLVLLGIFTFDQRRFHRHEFQQPSYAIRFLQDAGIEGNVFLSHMWGGELAFKMYPQCRPLCDIRLDLYSPDLVDVVVYKIQRDPITVYSIIDEADLQIAMVPNKAFQTNLFEYESEWQRVFDNGNTTIYLKDTPENPSNIQNVQQFYELNEISVLQDNEIEVASIILSSPSFFEQYSWLNQDMINVLNESAKSALRALKDNELNENEEVVINVYVDNMIEHGFFYETISFIKRVQAIEPLRPALKDKLANCYLRIGDQIMAKSLKDSPITSNI